MTEHGAHQGFQAGGLPGDLFSGTAACYSTFRKPYPPVVVDYLVERCALDGRGRLLDAGCGTGQVFQVMARHFGDVLAIDADGDMVDHARRTASGLKPDNVIVRRMRAEELTQDIGPLRMAIFGASFHWMDRLRVADMVYDLLAPDGCLAVLSPGGLHSGTTDWEAAVRAALARHLGPDRRAGGGIYREGERHEQVLARSRFERIEMFDISVHERWSIEEIVGCLYSTSYASKKILGGRCDAFERDVRENLLRLAPDGQFEKTAECTVILAEA
jgi:SAM-dependent methyltransferase